MVTATETGPARRAVFLDRDGVIVKPDFRDGRSFAPTTLDAFEIYEMAQPALQSLKDAGYLLVVITNQPDVGSGKIAPQTLQAMHDILRKRLPVDDIFVCEHTREDHCSCRKPKPGMLLAAARKWRIDLTRSYMVGDRSSDVEAGNAAGCRSIFIDYGYDEPETGVAEFRVADIGEAADIIVKASRGDT